MMKPIDNSPIPPAPVFRETLQRGAEKSRSTSFAEVVDSAVNQVNRLQKEAEGATHRMATGEVKGLHQTMIALEKADVSFRFIMEVRNKVIEAYREIMRMQV